MGRSSTIDRPYRQCQAARSADLRDAPKRGRHAGNKIKKILGTRPRRHRPRPATGRCDRTGEWRGHRTQHRLSPAAPCAVAQAPCAPPARSRVSRQESAPARLTRRDPVRHAAFTDHGEPAPVAARSPAPGEPAPIPARSPAPGEPAPISARSPAPGEPTPIPARSPAPGEPTPVAARSLGTSGSPRLPLLCHPAGARTYPVTPPAGRRPHPPQRAPCGFGERSPFRRPIPTAKRPQHSSTLTDDQDSSDVSTADTTLHQPHSPTRHRP